MTSTIVADAARGGARDFDPPIADLARRVDGPVLTPGDPGAAAEVATFNLAVTHEPVVTVGATGPADVAAAVTWAVANGLPVAVQATGHGPVRAVRDAVLVTTSRMDHVHIDPVRRRARVGAGVRWAQVNEAAARHGLAGVSGSSSSVGVVGYSLGGGLGPLSREYGFGADQVLAVELVTADGRVRRVDEHTEPELFWAIRGGKGNFGVVTEIEIGLVPVATIYAGAVFFAGGSARDVLHSFRTWAPTLPDRTSTSVALLNLPPAPELPEALRGQHVVMLRFAHHGGDVEGAELLAPMLEAGEVLLSGVGALPYTQSDAIHQDPTEPAPVWEKGALLRELSAEAVDALLAVAGPGRHPALAMVELRLMGGAIGRSPRVPNAVAGREGAYSLLALGVLAPGIEEAVPVACDAVVAALRPWATGTALLNWLGASASAAEVAAAWRPDVHHRLLAMKRSLDPRNVFRLGHALEA
ncbi:FAD-binding oxidoreductase [Nocardioides sp. GY 10113]|uniref:FAD-binding oxidoreductase n=1 Tax=Nocardioides sp. GY 10113 TaxID=2569761 RepID=UPI0010A80012|nr:FAD-binding oxidoreductase [Nocardioides sp. GY 10113]TIC88868.1 FAD-binding oxidoreductase [Nocardioides sp. GY 10113]